MGFGIFSALLSRFALESVAQGRQGECSLYMRRKSVRQGARGTCSPPYNEPILPIERMGDFFLCVLCAWSAAIGKLIPGLQTLIINHMSARPHRLTFPHPPKKHRFKPPTSYQYPAALAGRATWFLLE